jgi:hypothetical protein
MPSAASRYSLFTVSVLLGAACMATAAPITLVSDGFIAATDSLWHFQAAAYRDGVLSPGMEAEIPGYGPSTGQLKIDPEAASLRFMPKRLHNAFRSCFLAYRNDFRMDSVFASHVKVEILESVTDPTDGDSLGGLYVLVRYEDETGYQRMARTAAKVRRPQTVDLDTCALIPIRQADWLSSHPLDEHARSKALANITATGLFYISGNTATYASTSAKAFQIGGFRAKGELRWPPRLSGWPEEERVAAGDTLRLKWKFPRGLAGARFRWFRNEKPVPEAQGASYLYAPTLQDTRVHVFRAEAQLPNGDILPTGQIRVRVVKPAAPRIVQQSKDTTVPEGGDVIFKVKAEGMEPLAYKWYRNGKAIPGASKTFYSFVPSSIYEGGEYQCEVTDRLGVAARSRKATLVVRPGPGSESGFPSYLTVSAKAGVNASDFYQDGGAYPGSSYQWNFLQAGLQAVWQIRPRWSVQSDLLYSRKGVSRAFSDHDNTLTLDYLEVPLLLRIRLGKPLQRMPLDLLAGGYGAYLIQGESEEDWGAWKGVKAVQGFESWDYGAVMGMAWQVGALSLEWRYSLGFADLSGGTLRAPRTIGAVSGMIGFTFLTSQEAAR